VAGQLVDVEWIVPEWQRDSQVVAIEVAGGTVEDSDATFQPSAEEALDYAAAGFEPFTMIVAVASVTFIAQAVAKMWRDRNVKGGVLVDTRGDKLRVRVVPTLPNGRLVVVEDSGTKVVDHESENEGKALLADVLGTFRSAT
jgi:hypothetical protein